jgi:hypothetical protein
VSLPARVCVRRWWLGAPQSERGVANVDLERDETEWFVDESDRQSDLSCVPFVARYWRVLRPNTPKVPGRT